jgi:hypothetical protein
VIASVHTSCLTQVLIFDLMNWILCEDSDGAPSAHKQLPLLEGMSPPHLQRFRVHEESIFSEEYSLWNSASCSFLVPVFTFFCVGPVHSTLFSDTFACWRCGAVLLGLGELLLDCLILVAEGTMIVLNIMNYFPNLHSVTSQKTECVAAAVWRHQILHKWNVGNP